MGLWVIPKLVLLMQNNKIFTDIDYNVHLDQNLSQKVIKSEKIKKIVIFELCYSKWLCDCATHLLYLWGKWFRM